MCGKHARRDAAISHWYFPNVVSDAVYQQPL
jgi:hypothetical protein